MNGEGFGTWQTVELDMKEGDRLYPALSLAAEQSCALNFGYLPFRYGKKHSFFKGCP